MHAPGAGKGKGKEVPMLPCQGEKKKRSHKAKAQDDDEVEIVGERMAGARPSWILLDRLVMARRNLETFVDEAAFFGAPEESEEESTDEEEVAGEELDEELAGLWEDMADNPMSPKRK
ncbi:hypothetical protein BU15DRAFT_78213 [Melanogaster broomeanus]|nr:hypothetical protein BU15DRAFT_78213 [Melanogaster broomeanus]